MLDIYTKEDCEKLWALYLKANDVSIELDRWCRDNYNLKISEALTEDDYTLMRSWWIVEGDYVADYTRYMYPDSNNKADYKKAYEKALLLVKWSTDMLSMCVATIKDKRMKK